MKFLIVVTLLSSLSFAGTIGTYHKTANGKYPHFYKESPGDTSWSDEDQEKYDAAMDEAIQQLCIDTAAREAGSRAIES